MSNQTTPPDDADSLPYNATVTSYAAAESMKSHVGQQRGRIHQFIHQRGTFGATREEVELALNIPGNSVRPRWNELVKAGDIRNAGTTRETKAGRDAAVFVSCSPDQSLVASAKANWPTGGKSNPNKSDSAEFVPDFVI